MAFLRASAGSIKEPRPHESDEMFARNTDNDTCRGSAMRQCEGGCRVLLLLGGCGSRGLCPCRVIRMSEDEGSPNEMVSQWSMCPRP